MRLIALLLFFTSTLALAAGTVSTTRYQYKNAERVDINWVADAAAATVPSTTLGLFGYVVKIVTNPGATAPTTLYDMSLGDPEDVALDAIAAALGNRSATVTEQVYPLITGTIGTASAVPVLLAGNYTFALANNAVNSAAGRVSIYLVKP